MTSKVGILLTNLGTPDAPTTEALKRYLKEFLSDRRVVDVPRLIWFFILNGYILQTRPQKSAKLYEKVWTKDGSPLLIFTKKLAHKFAKEFSEKNGVNAEVAVGMRYGNPSIAEALESLEKAACDKILIFPLYPQYAAATTATTFDAVSAYFKKIKRMPEIRFIKNYHEEKEYTRALAESLKRFWQNQTLPDKVLFSFHGLPKRSVYEGDPYYYECHKTARLIADELVLPNEKWRVTFQSRFGKEEWLQPYTDATLEELAKSGIQIVDVVCPGFSVDCLETLEEIAGENKHVFLKHGGKSYRYVPALNDDDAHAKALVEIASRRISDWIS
jgi:ferrochelatase